MDTNTGTATIDEESSSGEDVRGAIEAAFAEHNVEVPETGLRVRDESGKFARKSAAAEGAPAAIATTAEPADKTVATAAAATTTPAAGAEVTATGDTKIAPPNTWKAEARTEWDKIPPATQKYIVDREAEVHKGFTRFDEERTFGKAMKDVMAPFMPTIQQLGLQPAHAVQALMNHDRVLRTGSMQEKTQLFSQLAQQFGVDIGQVRQQTGAIDPAVAALRTELSRLQHTVTQSQAQAQEQEAATVQEEIQRFGADKPHFATVAPIMGALMASGHAQDLQSAYDQAIYANPETRKAVLEAEAATREAARLAAIKEKSVKARNAAVSVTGAPGSQAAGTQPAATLREELAAQFAAQGVV